MRNSQAKSAPQDDRKKRAGTASQSQSAGFFQRWTASTLALGMTSAVLLFLALPPVGLWPLAWIAPLGWLWLIRRPTFIQPAMKSPEAKPAEAERASRLKRFVSFWRRPYPAIWLSGFAFWMGSLHWLRLPHWGTSVGWVALCFYFAFYIPLFVGLARVLVHTLRVSIILAAPIAWTAMEFIRAYMLTGFSMAELGHSQYQWISLIQIADLGGSFAVSFVVMLVAASLARMLPMSGSEQNDAAPVALWPLAPVAVVLAAVLAYGAWRTGQTSVEPDRTLRVALIQSSFDTEFRVIEGRDQEIVNTYGRLSLQAMQESERPIDLVVWPESMFRRPRITGDADAAVPSDWEGTPEEFRQELQAAEQGFGLELAAVREAINTPGFLAGVNREHFTATGSERYNSAVFTKQESKDEPGTAAPAAGQIPAFEVYDKMHAVPFGEYVPFARYFPWIYDVTPLTSGIEEGAKPMLCELNGLTFSPSICFESIQSHHIRDAVVELRDTDGEPDLLINVTNDGWFWGSSELDLHLICGVFRAIECRKPFLVAANTGISAVVDGNGNVLERGPKRGNAIIVRDIHPDPRSSPYLDYGPWLAWLCLATCGIAAVLGMRNWFRRPA